MTNITIARRMRIVEIEPPAGGTVEPAERLGELIKAELDIAGLDNVAGIVQVVLTPAEDLTLTDVITEASLIIPAATAKSIPCADMLDQLTVSSAGLCVVELYFSD